MGVIRDTLPVVAALGLLAVMSARAEDTIKAPPQIDLKHLPLGDTRISDKPKAGWIWACALGPFNGGGAGVDGPWIKGDGTYDYTAKDIVHGHVEWPSHFKMTIEGDKRVFTANDLPNHPTGEFPVSPNDPAYKTDRNPNHIAAQTIRIELPRFPVVAAQPSCTPGAVGILLTGAVLFDALDAQRRDAVAHEVQDSCQGHPQVTGTYHYHSVTSCQEDKRLADGHSELVGYAVDGFGIYGPFGEGGKPLTSADLDECHGHTHKIMWEGKAVTMYHYHGTWDFPYSVGCIRGTANFETVRAIAGPPPERGGPNVQGPNASGPGAGHRPDLNAAALKLGITPEQLRGALGPPPPDFAAAAKQLGISQEMLLRALNPPPQ